jgi:hypothetical protein
MVESLLQIVSGGYSPPPDYSSIRALFVGMAFDTFLSTLNSDMKFRTRIVLGIVAVGLLLTAIFTAPLVQLSPSIETWLRNLSDNPLTWFILVVILFETAYLSPIVARMRRARIDVVAPLANDSVQLKTVVFGMVHPRHHPVRVMIYSGDGRYHRQDAPTIFSKEGDRWSIECQFGLPNSGFDEHEIVAIDGNVEIDKVCAVLPSDIVKSLPVKVRRV